MKAGKHGYSGSCCPTESETHWSTFSVGVFQWVAKSSGEGVKKSKAKVRVTGSCAYPEKVNAEAERIVLLLDAGLYNGPKNVRVR